MKALSRGSRTLLSSYKKNKHHSPATPGGPTTGITPTVTQIIQDGSATGKSHLLTGPIRAHPSLFLTPEFVLVAAP